MNFGGKYFFIICGVIALAIISGVVYFLVGKSGIPGLGPNEASAKTQAVWQNVNGKLTFSWHDLPSNTRLLNIYKEDPKTGERTFVASLPVPKGAQASGTAELKVGKKISGDDTLSLDANSGEGPGNLPENVLWQSSPPPPGQSYPPSSDPSSGGNPTSSSNNPPPSSTPPPDQSGSSSSSGSSPSPSSTPSSTNPGSTPSSSTPTSGASSTTPSSTPSNLPPDNSTPSSSPTSSPPTTPPSSTPSSTPPSSIPSFQISNSTQWIEATWQNLPSNTDLIVFSRADNPSGPWEVFYSEADPETIGPYTVKVTIDTPNIPFYYQLVAYQNSSVIGTYGPVYLSALQQ